MNINSINNYNVQNNKPKTYKIKIKDTNDYFEVLLSPTNVSQRETNTDVKDNNTCTLKEICDKNPKLKMQCKV